jgi:hypothetical protein
MHRMIELYQQKNHYLEKFYSINETEILNFKEARFETLDYFYQTRESILEMLAYIDSEIADEIQKNPELNQDDRAELKALMTIKNEYVNRILKQDLDILCCIETAKSTIIRELQEIKKVKKAVGGYNSRLELMEGPKRLNEEI